MSIKRTLVATALILSAIAQASASDDFWLARYVAASERALETAVTEQNVLAIETFVYLAEIVILRAGVGGEDPAGCRDAAVALQTVGGNLLVASAPELRPVLLDRAIQSYDQAMAKCSAATGVKRETSLWTAQLVTLPLPDQASLKLQ